MSEKLPVPPISLSLISNIILVYEKCREYEFGSSPGLQVVIEIETFKHLEITDIDKVPGAEEKLEEVTETVTAVEEVTYK